MFNVNRTYPAPLCLEKKEYNTLETSARLQEIFYEKCYLCERDNIQNPEIEHLIPHEGNEKLKFDWDNLCYVCRRCNSIKSNIHKNILNPSMRTISIWKLIKCLMPSAPDNDVVVECCNSKDTTKYENTIKLLQQCYNLDNTGLRGISRATLIEQMWEHYCELLSHRRVLLKKGNVTRLKEDAKESIQAMFSVKYPFSSFWIHHCKDDARLISEHPDLFDKIDW